MTTLRIIRCTLLFSFLKTGEMYGCSNKKVSQEMHAILRIMNFTV